MLSEPRSGRGRAPERIGIAGSSGMSPYVPAGVLVTVDYSDSLCSTKPLRRCSTP